MHGIAYEAKHDEIVVPVALAAAVLVFRGGAAGAESPIRVIQGPHTQLVRPHTVAVDEQNGEAVAFDLVREYPQPTQGVGHQFRRAQPSESIRDL